MIKYVLFDLDDTLLDFRASEREALKETFEIINEPIDEDTYLKFSSINEEYFNKFAQKLMTREMFHKERFRVLLDSINSKLDPVYVNNLYVKSLSESAILFPDTLEILDYLKQKNYKLYVVSNGQKEVQLRRIQKCNISSYFDYVFISSEIGYNKPNIRFLEFVTNQIYKDESKENIDVDKSEFIMIGDRENADIKCANDFNIKSVLIGTSKTNATYKVKQLSEIKNIL